MKKLKLKRTTVRVLSGSDLRQAAGGLPPVSWVTICPTQAYSCDPDCPEPWTDPSARFVC